MARLLKNARVYLGWDDGERVEMGTLKLEGNKDGAVMSWIPKSRQRIGWDLVRIGMRMMFPGRKWKMVTRHDCEVRISDEQGTERVD